MCIYYLHVTNYLRIKHLRMFIKSNPPRASALGPHVGPREQEVLAVLHDEVAEGSAHCGQHFVRLRASVG